MREEDPPFALENVLAAVGHALVVKERPSDAELLASAEVTLEVVGHDNWDGGTTVWELGIAIPYPQYVAYEDPERKDLEAFIDDLVSPFLPEIGHWVHAKIKPTEFSDPDWRRNVRRRTGEGAATNQGRAHSANLASLEHDGLRFRSQPEILLYKALKSTGVPFAPLPVFVRGGARFSRVEPDFVIVKDGVVLFVEIDGAAYHRETPADAHYRLKPFQEEGVHVERVKAEHCNTPELAKRFAEHLVRLIEKWRDQR